MKVPRVIFNFNDRCLNGCPFCFTPFDNEGVGDISLWQRILMEIEKFSPELISFSGCDPLYYRDFYTLLQLSPKRCRWALDTSLVVLDCAQFEKIEGKIDLISTSIDDVRDMPVKQRYSPRTLERFWQNFDFVYHLKPNLVVHTLLTPINSPYVAEIGEKLVEKGVNIWSLYQFWPFDFIPNPERFIIDDVAFTQIGERIRTRFNGCLDVEVVLRKNRANGYFFVTSLGKVYTTVDQDGLGRYVTLGSIFDEDIYEKWLSTSMPARAEEILQRKLKRETKQ